MTETTKRVLHLMQKNSLNAHQLEVAVSLPNASVQSWVKGKKRKSGEIAETTPSSETITKLARYFNVSADYLLCLTDEPKPLEIGNVIKRPDFALSTELAELSKDKQFVNLAKMYKELSNEKREKIYSYIVSVVTGIDLI